MLPIELKNIILPCLMWQQESSAKTGLLFEGEHPIHPDQNPEAESVINTLPTLIEPAAFPSPE